MVTEPAVLLQAAFSSYAENVAPSSYWHDVTILTNTDGLYVEVYRRLGSNDYIVSFRGTEPKEMDDLSADANLGWPQYGQSRERINELINGLLGMGGRVDITGHSLGGALAQFAVYELSRDAKANGRAEILNRISLTTWNALGGVWGLERNGGYNAENVAGVDAHHYYRDDDLVSRLGKGHVGGEMLRLEDPEGQMVGVLDAHMQAELAQSLQAGRVINRSPDYFQIADSSQIRVGSLAMILLKLSRHELPGVGLVLPSWNASGIGPLADFRFHLDAGILLGTAVVQELLACIDKKARLREQNIKIIESAVAQGVVRADAMLDSVLDALDRGWPYIYAKGTEFVGQVAAALVDLGRRLIASQMASADPLDELQLWSSQEQWLERIEVYTGEMPGLHSLPGGLSLEPYGPLLDARLERLMPPRICPLVLDLEGDGLETLAIHGAGVRFDLDADGVTEACGWIGPREALLVHDRNRDGRIDSGRELFGDRTPLAAGGLASHGFAALAALDANGDGQVDALDPAWAELGLWRDADSDGRFDGGEWLSLTSAGVTSLDLRFSPGPGLDRQGNDLRLAGHYGHRDGGRRLLADVWFTTAATEALAPEAPAAALASGDPAAAAPLIASFGLPDIAGLGRVPALRERLAADSSGRLQQQLETWRLADDNTRQALLPDILYSWAGVADLPKPSTEGSFDPRMLAALHAFTTDRFLERPWDPTNPRNLAALTTTFEALCRLVGHLLAAREHLSPLWSRVIAVDASGSASVDADALDLALQEQLARATTDEQLIAAGQALKSHPLVGELLMGAIRSRAMDNLSQPDRRLWLLVVQHQRPSGAAEGWVWTAADAEVIELTPQELVDGGGGNDVLIGSDASDLPEGGDGDDLLLGGDGDDILRTGRGRDTLCGGRGNDLIMVDPIRSVIVFNPGDGQDRLTLARTSSSGAQGATLLFGKAVAREDVSVSRRELDLILSLRGRDDQVTVVDYYAWDAWLEGTTNGNSLESVALADGTLWGHPQLMQQAIRSSEGDDHLEGCAASETIDGGAGHDVIRGWGGSDLLLGGSGNDRIESDASSNTLVGGAGDDTLIVYRGTNRLRYDSGDGWDTVDGNSSDASNTLWLGPGITPSDLTITRSGSELTLSCARGGGGLRLPGFFVRTWCHSIHSPLRSIHFQDGSSWSWETLRDHFLVGNDADNQLIGFSNDDIMRGEGGHDLLAGRDGRDRLLGGSGNDTLSGEGGSDWLEGGDGNDTLVCNTVGGEDTLLGGAGSNVFHHIRGDVFLPANADGSGASANTLYMQLVLPETVTLGRQGNQLLITCTAYGVPGPTTIRVEDFFRDFTVLNRWNPLQVLTFGTGTRWDARSIASQFPNAFIGTSADNRLSARDSDDWLDGMEGHDQLQGLAGHDTLQGGSGNDTLHGGLGNDLLLGAEGSDTASWAGLSTAVTVDLALTGPQATGAGLDTLIGIEHLLGGSGADRLLGNEGANRLDGGDGDDTLEGGAGNDILSGGNHLSGGDTASYAQVGAAVQVTLLLTAAQNTGGAGSDQLSGIENLIGSAHGDSLSGSGVANRLSGGAGNDTLQGGSGADTLIGGDGTDQFVYATVTEAGNGSGSRDLLLDLGVGDRISLTAIDARSDQSGNQAFTWIAATGFSALGQLRYTRLSNGNGLLEGNCSGNLAADFQIELLGAPDLREGAALFL